VIVDVWKLVDWLKSTACQVGSALGPRGPALTKEQESFAEMLASAKVVTFPVSNETAANGLAFGSTSHMTRGDVLALAIATARALTPQRSPVATCGKTVTFPTQVLLSPGEVEQIRFRAFERQERNAKLGFNRHQARGESFQIDFQGALGEQAVCKALNVYPDYSVTFQAGAHDGITADGRTFDVKTGGSNCRFLTVHPHAKRKWEEYGYPDLLFLAKVQGLSFRAFDSESSRGDQAQALLSRGKESGVSVFVEGFAFRNDIPKAKSQPPGFDRAAYVIPIGSLSRLLTHQCPPRSV